MPRLKSVVGNDCEHRGATWISVNALFPGCTPIGPSTVPRDCLDYITALARSWKGQTLVNVVRVRYGDASGFLYISSVISGYALQGQLAAGAASSSDVTATIPSSLVTLGGNGA